eukprot:1612115-Lingulodinium_polyedra.AAC.1
MSPWPTRRSPSGRRPCGRPPRTARASVTARDPTPCGTQLSRLPPICKGRNHDRGRHEDNSTT